MILQRIDRSVLDRLAPDNRQRLEVDAQGWDATGVWVKPESLTGIHGLFTAGPDRMPQPPTLLAMATNFAAAMARWHDAGYRTLDTGDVQDRRAICEPCEHWRVALGFAWCRLCGCSKLKLWLPTEKCPLNKWHNIVLTIGSKGTSLDSVAEFLAMPKQRTP